MTVDELTRTAIERLGDGPEGSASALLPATDRRDEVTATATYRVSSRHGRIVQTVYRLNGDRIGHRAAELLLMAYGTARED